MSRAFFTIGLLGVVLFTSAAASGYCRTTTCDPTDPKQACKRDKTTKCLITGTPLYWASDCLSISVQADGAASVGIDYAAAEASVRRAFNAWTTVDCKGASPSLHVNVSGPVACDVSEYSKDHKNANIVMFRENDWPYVGAEDALGLTRVRFDLDGEPGALWDADIEINAVTEPLSIGLPQSNEVDLDSLLAHEAGHVLGLGHTLDVFATMVGGYETGTSELASPAADDIAGICEIYPPGRKPSSTSCEPRHGFSELCGDEQPLDALNPDAEGDGAEDSKGCSFALSGKGSQAPFFWSLALGVCLAWRLRQRRP